MIYKVEQMFGNLINFRQFCHILQSANIDMNQIFAQACNEDFIIDLLKMPHNDLRICIDKLIENNMLRAVSLIITNIKDKHYNLYATTKLHFTSVEMMNLVMTPLFDNSRETLYSTLYGDAFDLQKIFRLYEDLYYYREWKLIEYYNKKIESTFHEIINILIQSNVEKSVLEMFIGGTLSLFDLDIVQQFEVFPLEIAKGAISNLNYDVFKYICETHKIKFTTEEVLNRSYIVTIDAEVCAKMARIERHNKNMREIILCRAGILCKIMSYVMQESHANDSLMIDEPVRSMSILSMILCNTAHFPSNAKYVDEYNAFIAEFFISMGIISPSDKLLIYLISKSPHIKLFTVIANKVKSTPSLISDMMMLAYENNLEKFEFGANEYIKTMSFYVNLLKAMNICLEGDIDNLLTELPDVLLRMLFDIEVELQLYRTTNNYIDRLLPFIEIIRNRYKEKNIHNIHFEYFYHRMIYINELYSYSIQPHITNCKPTPSNEYIDAQIAGGYTQAEIYRLT